MAEMLHLDGPSHATNGSEASYSNNTDTRENLVG